MKSPLLTGIFISFLFPNFLFAQGVQNLSFKYKCVPTSTSDYSIEICKDNFILNKAEKIPDKRGRIKKVDSSNYIHSFDSKEREILDSIIKVNKLDSICRYQDRVTEWGTLWEVTIERNSITYNIDLPNYNNVGLESLIHFILCLIPRKELPRFKCKKCSPD